jgi:hypothetical protein
MRRKATCAARGILPRQSGALPVETQVLHRAFAGRRRNAQVCDPARCIALKLKAQLQKVGPVSDAANESVSLVGR